MDEKEMGEKLHSLIKKCYNKIQLNVGTIDHYMTSIFKEFNELSLIHESKLGHTLKDMQQFLEYQQSSDERIQAIFSKLDIIIEILEKKMQIEIFGEEPLDCLVIRKMLKVSDNSSKVFPHMPPPN